MTIYAVSFRGEPRWELNPGFRNTPGHPPVTDFILQLYYTGNAAQSLKIKNQISKIYFISFAHDNVHTNTVKKGVQTRYL